MGKSAPKAPAPVDPNVMSGAQSRANKDTAEYQQKLNMVGATGPGGSVKYVRDPSQPGGYSQVTELSQGQQGLYDLGLAAQTGALGVANNQIGRLGTALDQQLTRPDLVRGVGPTDFTADREAMTDAVFNRARSRLDPMWGQAEDKLDTRLANQGLSGNSSAAITAREGFGRNKNDAYDQALTSAILAGSDQQQRGFDQSVTKGNFANSASQQDFGNQAFARSQPISDFSALLGMGDIMMPQQYSGPQTSVAGTDVLGAFGLNSQQQQNAYNAKLASNNSKNAGIAQLGSAALQAAIMSDARVKKNIRRIGSADGHNLYVFHYHGEPDTAPLRLGVMAQEVGQSRPDAVVERDDGVLTVDYAKLFQDAHETSSVLKLAATIDPVPLEMVATGAIA